MLRLLDLAPITPIKYRFLAINVSLSRETVCPGL